MALNTNPDTCKWYPVYTNPRAEKKAYQALINKGINAYLPLHRQLKKWSDRKKWVEEPFIKSYLFVYIKKNRTGRGVDDKRRFAFHLFFGRGCIHA